MYNEWGRILKPTLDGIRGSYLATLRVYCYNLQRRSCIYTLKIKIQHSIDLNSKRKQRN